MTPVQITALLEVYVSPPGHRPTLDRADSLSRELCGLGLVDREDKCCVLTDKGRAHVEQLMSLGLPKQAWMTSDGRCRIEWEDK